MAAIVLYRVSLHLAESRDLRFRVRDRPLDGPAQLRERGEVLGRAGQRRESCPSAALPKYSASRRRASVNLLASGRLAASRMWENGQCVSG